MKASKKEKEGYYLEAKIENWKPKTENRKPKTENRKPKTENQKPKTENWKMKTENHHNQKSKSTRKLKQSKIEIENISQKQN
jgi:hypothetical protein